jgi:hypothetical protein
MEFNLQTAQTFAENGRSEEWIYAYLAEGSWANPGLFNGLKLQKRYWRGPLQLSLDDLVRTCGPEPEMPYRVSQYDWDERTGDIADALESLEDLPPFIVQYVAGDLILCDGNHRYGALRKMGWTDCWAFIWYDSQQELAEHLDQQS